MKNLIKHFEDEDYKKFIFLSYGIIIEEWLLSIFEYEKYSLKEKFHYMIHVNEIIQNRLLAEKLSSFISNEDGLINIENILSKLKHRPPSTGLVYITSTIRNLDNNNCFYILSAGQIGDDSTYRIDDIKLNELNAVRNDFIDKFIIEPGSTKKEQDEVLDHYGKVFFKNSNYPQSSNIIVIPNNLSLTLPIHMARINGNYLYEKSEYRYLPNLHILKTMDDEEFDSINELTIFYASEDKKAVDEARAIDRSITDMKINLVEDPKLEEIKENITEGASVHIIAHSEYGNIVFNNNILNGFELCDALPKSICNVSFSVCKSGKVFQKGIYPFEHSSWSHKMLSKKAKRVLTHTWNLGQDASNEFVINYYRNNTYYKDMFNNKPSEYGGYIIWGLWVNN